MRKLINSSKFDLKKSNFYPYNLLTLSYIFNLKY